MRAFWHLAAGAIVWTGGVGAAPGLRLDFSPSILAAKAVAPPVTAALNCPRCAVAPVIDGELGDLGWRQAAAVDTLSRLTPATRVRACFDDTAIFLAVECENPDGREAHASVQPRDSSIWQEDCVEVWLDPHPERGELHQFIVNAAGSVYESRGGNTRYNPVWAARVGRDTQGWRVEMAIPHRALGLDAPKARLGFNLGRNGPGIEPRSWRTPYGNTTGSALILEGVTPTTPERREAVFSGTPFVAVAGEGLVVKLERRYARPGERWIVGDLAIASEIEPESVRLRGALYDLGESPALEVLELTPARHRGRILVDLRRHKLRQARMALSLMRDGETIGSAQVLLTAQACSRPLLRPYRVPVRVDLPTGASVPAQYPVTFGVPFPAGALWDTTGLRVVDGAGRPVPAQTEVTGRWGPEGALKWVRFDALVSGAGEHFVEVVEAADTGGGGPGLSVVQEDGTLVIATGVAEYVLGRGASPVREIRIDGRPLARDAGARGLYVVDQTGRLATAADPDMTVTIESRGPIAACVKFDGAYRTAAGEELARHVTRIECAAGNAAARVVHTLILTRNTNDIWFQEVGWELAVTEGEAPRALFGGGRGEDAEHTAVAFGTGADAAYMLQDSHYHFAHGTNHFAVCALRGADIRTVHEGEECGDWAALVGDQGGLMFNCRDAARLHPKEFTVQPGLMTLKLFSDRGGEELDFRGPALVRRWDLAGWITHQPRDFAPPDIVEKVSSYKSNAMGWARTHELLVSPLDPNGAAATAALASRLHSGAVYVHVDPECIRDSLALGALHPRDPQRFPGTERLTEAALEYWQQVDAAWGDCGFVDYFAGPHISYRGHKYPLLTRYVSSCTYTLRSNLWLAYARSGDRAVRAFAEGTNRTHMDSYHAHCDTPGGNVRGLFRNGTGFSSALPVYWGERNSMEISSSSNLDAYITFYQLTGYRRARDCVEAWADGVKRYWTYANARRTGRIIMLLRQLAQAHTLTWDPALADLARATTDLFEDQDAQLHLSKDRGVYRSSLYKTQVDVRGLIDAWNILGWPRHREMARRVSDFWWHRSLGTDGFGYNNPMAIVSAFLYDETGDPAYAQALAVTVRHHASCLDPELGRKPGPDLQGFQNASSTAFTFETGLALDVMARSDADQRAVASWAGYGDSDRPVRLIVHKPDAAVLELHYRTTAVSRRTGGSASVRPLNPPSAWQLAQNRLWENVSGSSGVGCIRIPKDSAECDYEITFAEQGEHYVFSNMVVPMVLHAPGFWQPLPNQGTGVRYFFMVPDGAARARIFFEGSARLFTPDGAAYGGGAACHGWTELPSASAGLWAFAPVDNRMVAVEGIPPFFAVENPEFYFTPDVPGDMPQSSGAERASAPADAENPPPIYGAGAIKVAGNTALRLSGSRHLIVEAGPERTAAGEGTFLPYEQGTVEFWIKPLWHSAEVGDGNRTLCLAKMRDSGFFTLSHSKSASGKSLLWFFSAAAKDRSTVLRNTVENIFFRRDEWLHVALVWGRRDGVQAYPGLKARDNVFVTEIYLNGRRRRIPINLRIPGGRPQNPLSRLTLGAGRESENPDCLYDELRISAVMRYDGDFSPPSRYREFEPDEHTRALFHFNGDTVGMCYGAEGGVTADLKGR